MKAIIQELISIIHSKNKRNKQTKENDIILYLESDFFNNLKMDIKNFSTEELFSKFSDYYIKNFILS